VTPWNISKCFLSHGFRKWLVVYDASKHHVLRAKRMLLKYCKAAVVYICHRIFLCTFVLTWTSSVVFHSVRHYFSTKRHSLKNSRQKYSQRRFEMKSRRCNVGFSIVISLHVLVCRKKISYHLTFAYISWLRLQLLNVSLIRNFVLIEMEKFQVNVSLIVTTLLLACHIVWVWKLGPKRVNTTQKLDR
jgi:hypothetical protein